MVLVAASVVRWWFRSCGQEYRVGWAAPYGSSYWDFYVMTSQNKVAIDSSRLDYSHINASKLINEGIEL